MNKNLFTRRALCAATLLLATLGARAQSNLGIGTASPDASALVEMQATNKGALLPRVALQNLADAGTVLAPATSLLVFNTNAALAGGTGFYYNAGTAAAPAWTKLNTGAVTGDDLGTGVATTDVNLGIHALVGTGDDIGATTVGLGVRADGGINIGQNTVNNRVAIGYQAGRLQEVFGGAGSLCIGYQSGYNNTSSQNMFIGYQSGYTNTTGADNSFSGNGSGYGNTIGRRNSFFGESSGYSNQDGNDNVFVGNGSGISNISGNKNVFVGGTSGNGSTGNNNAAVGYGANISGNINNATAIGYNSVASQSNTLALGGTGANAVKVGIGTGAPLHTLEVVGTINSSGTITTNAGFSSSSDRRFKQDIQTLPHALAQLVKLRGVSYTFRQQDFPTRHFPSGQQIGVIAQELEQVFPELVTTGEDGYKAVNYAQLTPVLLEAIKEQQQQIEALKAQATAATQRADQAASAQATQTADIQSLKTQLARLLGEQPATLTSRR